MVAPLRAAEKDKDDEGRHFRACSRRASYDTLWFLCAPSLHAVDMSMTTAPSVHRDPSDIARARSKSSRREPEVLVPRVPFNFASLTPFHDFNVGDRKYFYRVYGFQKEKGETGCDSVKVLSDFAILGVGDSFIH